MNHLTPDVRNAVIEEIEAGVIETVKNWKELQIKTYHSTGETLRRFSEDNNLKITELVKSVGTDARLKRIQMGERSLWFALKLYDEFPDFEKVYETEHGLNISVAKLKAMFATPALPKPVDLTSIAQRLFDKLGRELTKQLINLLEKLYEADAVKEKVKN